MPETSRNLDAFLNSSTGLFKDADNISAQDLRDFCYSANILTGPDVAITGAATATLGQWNVCTGTTGNYTVTLPPVSGNGGKYLGLEMDTALTKLVTVDGNGSETINGALTRDMWSNETAVLYCNGTNWRKRGGTSIAMVGHMYLNTTQTGITTGSFQKVLVNTSGINNTGMMVNTTNNRIDIIRTSMYKVRPLVVWELPGTFPRFLCRAIDNLGVTAAQGELNGVANAYPAPWNFSAVALVKGQYVELEAYHDSGVNKTVYGESNPGTTGLLLIEELQW